MKIKLFFATAVVLSWAWSLTAHADSILNTNRGLVAALATLKDTSNMASFFNKYDKSINHELVVWSFDREKTLDGDRLYSLIFILCSNALNQKKECDSPQLIIESQMTLNTGFQQASAKFVDQNGFVFSLAGAAGYQALNKPLPASNFVQPEDIGFISALAKLRIKGDPSLEKFFNKANTRPRAYLSKILKITKNSEVRYEISDSYELNDYYSKTPCGVHSISFSDDSGAEYTDLPQLQGYCHPSQEGMGLSI